MKFNTESELELIHIFFFMESLFNSSLQLVVEKQKAVSLRHTLVAHHQTAAITS